MVKTDIIKTYIFEPNYIYNKKYDYCEIFKIFNNNLILYIKIYYETCYYKIKQIKQNYIIYSYFNYNDNKTTFTKVKNYDNTNIDINTFINFNNIFNFDLKITNNCITKKIDKINNLYIIKDINIKYVNNIAIRKHTYFNSKHYYSKKYITYYINYYIIIYLDITYKSQKYNIILCNHNRYFMLFI